MAMVEKKYARVKCALIDVADQRFSLAPQMDASLLIPSIREAGLINPPILQKKKTGYRIVTGFKRVRALQMLKVKEVDAFVVKAAESDLDMFLLAVRDKLSTRRLDAIELSLFIHKLQHEFGVDRENIIKRYLPLAGYGRNPRVCELYGRLHELPDEWRQTVREEQTPVDVANDMLDRPEKERTIFFSLFHSLRLGKNRQREFVLLLSDVARSAEKSVAGIFESEPVQQIINDEKQTPSQKADRLKGWLMRRRYPRYAQAEAAFAELIKNRKLPDGLAIQPPPFFEGERFSAAFSFSTQEEFQKHLAALQRLMDDGVIQKIIDMP